MTAGGSRRTIAAWRPIRVVEGRHGFVADVADEAGLLAALRCIDDNPAIHLRSADCPPIRTADQQAEEPAAINGRVLDAPQAKPA